MQGFLHRVWPLTMPFTVVEGIPSEDVISCPRKSKDNDSYLHDLTSHVSKILGIHHLDFRVTIVTCLTSCGWAKISLAKFPHMVCYY